MGETKPVPTLSDTTVHVTDGRTSTLRYSGSVLGCCPSSLSEGSFGLEPDGSGCGDFSCRLWTYTHEDFMSERH